jgi:cytochrome c biogenesis protein CcdA
MAEILGFFFIAFLAGILTATAPCVLPIVPVILGGSIAEKDKARPYIVVGALSASIIIFTLILKASTALIGVPPWVWNYVSGGIVIFFGLTLLFPDFWEKIQSKLRLYDKSNRFLGKGYKKGGFWGAVMIGGALGPVFSSCSPVYLVILSVTLPTNFVKGSFYITGYALGFCLVLLLVAEFGQALVYKFKWLENPSGWFKCGLGLF